MPWPLTLPGPLRRPITTTSPSMTYILSIGPWHVGPFPTHAAATWWAEAHGVDSYDMLQMDDPAEAPAKIQRLRE